MWILIGSSTISYRVPHHQSPFQNKPNVKPNDGLTIHPSKTQNSDRCVPDEESRSGCRKPNRQLSSLVPSLRDPSLKRRSSGRKVWSLKPKNIGLSKLKGKGHSRSVRLHECLGAIDNEEWEGGVVRGVNTKTSLQKDKIIRKETRVPMGPLY